MNWRCSGPTATVDDYDDYVPTTWSVTGYNTFFCSSAAGFTINEGLRQDEVPVDLGAGSNCTSTSCSFLATGLELDTAYDFKIRAHNSLGWGE